VVSGDDEGKAWLSVGDFQSEADEDGRAKDREETKRLLYVALTRARDRLYLALEAKDGRFRPFGGSLADVLPSTLGACFEAAAARPCLQFAEWGGPSGNTHSLRVCTAPAGATVSVRIPDGQPAEHSPSERDRADDFQPLVDPFALPRVAATATPGPAASAATVTGLDRGARGLVGTLVHALFERHGTALARESDGMAVRSAARRLLRDDEALGSVNPEELLDRASRAYLARCAKQELTLALDEGDPTFEAPFSFRAGSTQAILRGTFDCLIRRRDGGYTILELKTGEPSPEHTRQLAVYLTAARALFPGTAVEGKLIYAG
jgi:ATP-dependent exoDNAse (exonuclease V) beta subunit